MNIPSRQEIKDKLQQVATEAGYSGSVVDLIISLMSTGYYETILRSVGILRESNAETAANINSLITLAASRMYSTFRGKNCKLVLKGNPTGYQELKRGYRIYSSEAFNLYVSEDMELSPAELISGNLTEIPIIASKNFIYQSKKNSPDRYFTEFLTSDLTEDIILYEQVDQSAFLDNDRGIQVELTKNFREHSVNNILFDLTIQDFGLRIYTKTPNDHNYTLSAFTYLPDSAQLIADFLQEVYADREFDQSADLDINLDLRDFELHDIEITNYFEPRETLAELRNNYNSQIDSIYLIRSNSDLLDTFNLDFGHLIDDVSIKQFGEFNPQMIQTGELSPTFLTDSVPAMINTQGALKPELPYAIFYYIPKDPNNLITVSDMVTYINAVEYYYMMDNLYCCPGTPKSYDLNITITSIDPIHSRTEIEKLVSRYDHKLGLHAYYYNIITEIAKIESVTSIRELDLRDNDNSNYSTYEINLKFWQYSSINLTLTIL